MIRNISKFIRGLSVASRPLLNLNQTQFCSNKSINCKLGNISSNDFHGIRPVRKCTEEQKNLLEQGYEKLLSQGKIQDRDTEINWYSIYMNGDLTVPKDEFWLKFHNAIEKLFYETEDKQQKIYSYGILVNPINSQKDQFYHFDYAGKTGTIFISMVYHTTENSTQYLNDFVPSTKPDLGPRNYNCYGYNDIQLLQKQNVDFLEVSQVICKPFTILKGGKRTIHRGVKNRGSVARPVLYMNFGAQEYEVKEPAQHSFENQKVRRQQMEEKGKYEEYYKE